jgi:hypothetical protein
MSHLVKNVTIDRPAVIKIIIICALLTIISVFCILSLTSVYSLATRASHRGYLDLLLLSCVGVLIVHELVHGIAYKVLGGKPKYGVRLQAGILPILYTSSVGTRLSLRHMLFVGLSPFFVVSISTSLIAAVPLLSGYAFAAFAVNFVGSAGDLWLASQLWRYRHYKRVVVEDTENGFKIFAQ